MRIEIHGLSKDVYSTIHKFILDSVSEIQMLEIDLTTYMSANIEFDIEFNLANLFTVSILNDYLIIHSLQANCKVPCMEFSDISII